MPIREVKKVKEEYLRPLNQGLVAVGSAVTFEEYVNTVYVPTEMPLLASSTQERYGGILKNYLVPTFGDRCLRELTPVALQQYISGFKIKDSSGQKTEEAEKKGVTDALERASVVKIRVVLSSCLGSAVKYGYLVSNSAAGLKVRPDKRGKRRQKPFIRPDQFAALLELIAEPYATMIYVAVYTGLRVSELIGLRWNDIHDKSITIDERYCRGDWGEPKSDASNTTIPVNRKVIERIQRLPSIVVEVRAGRATRRYSVVKSTKPDALVFQSVKAGRAMRDNNILTRHIKPAAKKLGIEWVNWQVLRRSYATWLRMVGTDPRDRQSLMRHSRFTTTAEIYEQDLPESQVNAVEKLGNLLN